MKSNVQLTISLTGLGLNNEDLQAKRQNLLPQSTKVNRVEDADLVPVENAPKNTKTLSSFYFKFFNAEVNIPSIKTLFNLLSAPLANKPMKMVLKAPNGKN
ncbi:sugar ABC transporter permease [Chrysosporum ovalisporum ANA283AFssAo]|uniref:sugar ABC transporter permease n=2 Tax=Umezakia ovalisporum TaxID=75695 RepID=UPI002472EB60|nr:sugar ABC transporter permease [Umezakia ovalisporum]MDH6101371.1 sugar ABC transporter permease [Umezakia ovalisporum ANA283AFssAo]